MPIGIPEWPEFASYMESTARIRSAFADWELEILLIFLRFVIVAQMYFYVHRNTYKKAFFWEKI